MLLGNTNITSEANLAKRQVLTKLNWRFMAVTFFSIICYVLKSSMILKRNGNTSNYEIKLFLMQQMMLPPDTNTFLVKIGSQ